ncbi:cellulase family glycosylhydrolase [Nannocystaceae bacterium ST9]
MNSARTAALALLSLCACKPDPSSDDEAGTSESESAGTSESESAGTSESESSETGDPLLPGECEQPIAAVEPSDARLIVEQGGVMRDALGRDVIVRGVNTGNRNKTPPFMPFPIADDISLAELRPLADEYFARMRTWGLDTARLPFSWEALEPVRDVWDEEYLDRYEVLVDAAWGQGIRVIVDFHQDIWSRNYCGDGFPTWAVADPDAAWHECPDAQWGLKYLTDTDVQVAFDRFWANEDGLKDEFLMMWTKVGERFADHPGVLALEVLNEPGWGTVDQVQQWKLDVLTPFHTAVAAYLHELAPDLLIVYDNPGIDGAGLDAEMVHPRPEGDFLIYGPHLYGASFYSPQLPSPQILLAEMAAFGRDADVPVLLGEFGFQPHETAGPVWLAEVAEGLDTQRMSATLWEYSFNDPLWNFENFSLLDAQGDPQPVLDAWVRPWLRAVAGDDPSFAWDLDAQQGSASWTASAGVTEIVLPPLLFGQSPSEVTIAGEGACFTIDMDRGELRVQANPGANVEVAFSR